MGFFFRINILKMILSIRKKKFYARNWSRHSIIGVSRVIETTFYIKKIDQVRMQAFCNMDTLVECCPSRSYEVMMVLMYVTRISVSKYYQIHHKIHHLMI